MTANSWTVNLAIKQKIHQIQQIGHDVQFYLQRFAIGLQL